jgi:hypothetical protein
MCGNHQNIIPLFKRLGRSLTALLSSLRYEAHPHLAKWRPKDNEVREDTSHNSHMILFTVKTKRLECYYGQKWKLHLMKGSLIRLPLRLTRHHRTNRLSLHFHATSAMIQHAPPTVAHSLILRQNRETIVRLASGRSKMRMSMRVLTPSSSTHRVLGANRQTSPTWFWCPNQETVAVILRHKPRNHHDDFEAQIIKPLTLVFRPRPRNCRSGFMAKLLSNHRHQFWD